MRQVKPTFEEYLATLGRLTSHVDPTLETPEAVELRSAAQSLAELENVTVDVLTTWVEEHPAWVPALGLVVGMSQEQLRNQLRHHLGSSGWLTLARLRSAELIEMLDREFDVVRLVSAQRLRSYDLGDVLIARGGTRGSAMRAGASGRRVEDEIEAIARELGLPCRTRTRFTGRNGRQAPCDLAIPDEADALIVVAAKGFDSTGSKLSDAVREIEEMAAVRHPRQFVLAVIDGIGWKHRQADLRRLHALWVAQDIDGMYTLATLSDFKTDVQSFARRLGLLE